MRHMKEFVLVIVLIVVLMVALTAPVPAAATTGHWWCLQDGVPTVETPYTDPSQNGYRQAVIWCRLNTGQADAGFLE